MIRLGIFATGGGDGSVSIWDGFAKKRLRKYKNSHTSISTLAFNNAGTFLAVGISYMWDQGFKDPLPPTNIMIYQINDSEFKKKFNK